MNSWGMTILVVGGTGNMGDRYIISLVTVMTIAVRG